jgi:hypothetical protein
MSPTIQLSDGEIARVRQHVLDIIRILNGRVPLHLIDRHINTLKWLQHRGLQRRVRQANFSGEKFPHRYVGAHRQSMSVSHSPEG